MSNLSFSNVFLMVTTKLDKRNFSCPSDSLKLPGASSINHEIIFKAVANSRRRYTISATLPLQGQKNCYPLVPANFLLLCFPPGLPYPLHLHLSPCMASYIIMQTTCCLHNQLCVLWRHTHGPPKNSPLRTHYTECIFYYSPCPG